MDYSKLYNDINLGMLSYGRLEVIVSNSLPEYKYRAFKWKFKWWQIPFNGFKKYVEIIGKIKNRKMYVIGNKLIVRPEIYQVIKKELEGRINVQRNI